MHQRFQESAQQFVQAVRFQLHPEQLVKRLRFRLAHLVVGVVERQDHAEVKLLAHPLKVRVLIGNQSVEDWRQQAIVLLQRFENRAGRQV